MSEEWMRELQSTAAPQQQDVIRWPHAHHHHKHSLSSSFISSMQQHAMQHPARNMPHSGNANIANMGIEGNNPHAVNTEQQSNHIMSAIYSPSCMTAVTMTGHNNWQPPQEGHYYYMGLQPAAASMYGGMMCNLQQYSSCPAMPRTSASDDDNKLGENAEKAPWNECLQTVQYDTQDRTATTLYNEHHPNMSMITNAEVEDNGRGRMRVFSEDYTAIQPEYRAGLLRKGIELGPAYTEQVGNSRWHEGRNASSREGLKVQIHPRTDTISNKDPGMVAHARTSSICHSITNRQSQEGNFQLNRRHQLINVRSAGLEKNRKTQWGTSICMASGGGKDRHSKVKTSKGMRDRRVRLSVSTAAQFYDIQDRLGFEQPSHVFEWLMQKAKHAINELPSAAPHVDHHVPAARNDNIGGVGAATLGRPSY